MFKKITGESIVYIVLIILIGCFYFASNNWELYEFWKELIDNTILLFLLIIILISSYKNNWNFYSQRILYSFIFINILNIYTTLFGMPITEYFRWYFIPLIVMMYVMTFSIVWKIIYTLYKLWENGKIKFF